MKLLFDQNLSFKLCQLLIAEFPGSEQVGRLGMSEADDRTIWRYAAAHGYTLVSLDADFAEMAAVLGSPPKVVWLRCGNLPTNAVAHLLRANAGVITAFEQDEAACLELY